MSKIVVIIGPTASGKTKLSIEVAKMLNAEIINADAVQIYKDVNIGTAKVTKEEMQGIKHHMIDFNPLCNKYTIYDYQKEGRIILNELINKNRNIVVVGGSGLYIKALLYDYSLEMEAKNKNEVLNILSNQELKNIVKKIDSNNNIHINNRKRLLRFIDHYNKTNSIIKNESKKDIPLYDFIIIGLKVDRSILYEMIDKRVDIMFENGLLEEAKSLFDKNIDTNAIIGYRELNKYFQGTISLEEAKEEIKRNTRRYSKRQMTWNNHQFPNIKFVEVDYCNFNKTIEDTKKLI